MRGSVAPALVTAAGLGLAACATNRPPVIEEYTGTTVLSSGAVLSTISSDAAYRTAYILLGKGTERGDGSAGASAARYSGQFCPEPPPDVAQSISAAFAAALEGKVTPPAGATAVEGAAEVQNAIATAVLPLLTRTQGLQFYRDLAFYNCVAYLNGALGQDEYRRRLTTNADLAADLIALQIVTDGKGGSAEPKATEADLAKAVGLLDTWRRERNGAAPAG